MPLHDPYAVHVDGSDTLEGNWSLGGFNLTNGGSGTFATISLLEQSSNPDAPADGQAVIWLSDGSGYGDAGDVMIASTTSSVTRYGTLFDYSGGTLWEADVMIYENSDVMLLESGDTMVFE